MNVVKHAKAHNVNVYVAKQDNSLRITVEDDGIGFAKDKLDLEYKKFKGLKYS